MAERRDRPAVNNNTGRGITLLALVSRRRGSTLARSLLWEKGVQARAASFLFDQPFLGLRRRTH
jgi:hypothetical protein